MIIGLLLTIGFVLVVWLVFFKFKWLKWSVSWAFMSIVPFLHLLLIFMIGLRFVTPYSMQRRQAPLLSQSSKDT